MRQTLKYLTLTILLFGVEKVSGQQLNPGDQLPAGAILYSLPRTTLNLEVEAECETYVAGPYARYAQKYIGVEAQLENSKHYRVVGVELKSEVEADPQANIALNLGNNRNASANFLEMTRLGLIVWSDAFKGGESSEHPLTEERDLFAKIVSAPNLTKEESTLYRTTQSASGVERVAVRQSQVVEKSIEKRAEEAAFQLFDLRRKKINIITGDTDATFSGDALRAAVEELNRLEEEYLSLFLGKRKVSYERATFTVIPKVSEEKQIYIAFRVSDSEGLLPSSNLSGRPIVLELFAEERVPITTRDNKESKGVVLYRKPLMVTAKLSDGQKLLLESRIPVYQLGETLTFPIAIATGRL